MRPWRSPKERIELRMLLHKAAGLVITFKADTDHAIDSCRLLNSSLASCQALFVLNWHSQACRTMSRCHVSALSSKIQNFQSAPCLESCNLPYSCQLLALAAGVAELLMTPCQGQPHVSRGGHAGPVQTQICVRENTSCALLKTCYSVK